MWAHVYTHMHTHPHTKNVPVYTLLLNYDVLLLTVPKLPVVSVFWGFSLIDADWKNDVFEQCQGGWTCGDAKA